MLKRYISLVKPGIIRGNVITAAGGFFLASMGNPDLLILGSMIWGLALVIASACVVNNIIDRDIDRIMERTKHRPLAQQDIPLSHAVTVAVITGVWGFGTLLAFTNALSFLCALFGFVVYVGTYSLWAKRNTTHGTLIGSFSGAVPPVVGYTTVTHSIDTAAVLLFIILVLWQMVHFFSVAMYRIDDYTRARIPVVPVIKGEFAAKLQIVMYINAFIVASVLLTALGYTGYVYLVIMLALGIFWIILALRGFSTTNMKRWSRRMFAYSLLVLLTFSILISIPS